MAKPAMTKPNTRALFLNFILALRRTFTALCVRSTPVLRRPYHSIFTALSRHPAPVRSHRVYLRAFDRSIWHAYGFS